MNFEVVVTEHHQVRFSYNKFWGSLRITVDDTDVVRTVRLASLLQSLDGELVAQDVA